MRNKLSKFTQLVSASIRSVLVCVLTITAPSVAVSQNSVVAAPEIGVNQPSSVLDLMYARPFSLSKGYKFNWRKDQPVIDSGVIVVLKVDPELVIPRNAPEPILYAGDMVVQRLNHGHLSGHVIAIIPGAFDFSTQPVWFGKPGLPLAATTSSIKSERAAAYADLQPLPAQNIRAVTRGHMQAPNLASLLRGEIADLVLQFSPEESDLARKWRLPEATVEPYPEKQPELQ